MKKGIVTIIVLAVVALGLFSWGKNAYNGLVKGEEGVEAAWAQVENVYQRRADLIPNLVATVKGYAEHESSTLQAVIEARAKATQTKIDPAYLSAEEIAKFQAAQGELSQALGRLLVTVERYPDLKANLPRSAPSRRTSSPAFSTSRRRGISRLPKGPKPLRR